MAFDEHDGAGKSWSPPYITGSSADPGRRGGDGSSRGWQRRHWVVAVAAVFALVAGAATVPFLLNGSGGGVTVVAASPPDVPPETTTPAPTTAPPPTGVPETQVARSRPVSTRTVRTTGTAPRSRPAPTTPRFVPPPSELARAAAALARTERTYRALLASPTASSVDREVGAFEVALADQYLTDLQAGRRGAVPRRLQIRGAQAYLAQAQQSHRRTLADTRSSQAEREAAAALVETWQEKLAEAQRR